MRSDTQKSELKWSTNVLKDSSHLLVNAMQIKVQ